MNRFYMSKYTIIYENLSREYYSLKLFNQSEGHPFDCPSD